MADQAMPDNRLKSFRMQRYAVGGGKNYHRAISEFCNTFTRSSDIARARRHVAFVHGRAGPLWLAVLKCSLKQTTNGLGPRRNIRLVTPEIFDGDEKIVLNSNLDR